MAGKRPKPEEIGAKLRQFEVLQGQGMSVSDAVRQIGITQNTCYHWRKQYGGMSKVQLKRLEELESEASSAIGPRELPSNHRLRSAVTTPSEHTAP